MQLFLMLITLVHFMAKIQTNEAGSQYYETFLVKTHIYEVEKHISETVCLIE